MGKGGFGAALAGALSGYTKGLMYNDQKAREDDELGMRKQEHDARMDEVNRTKQDRATLANAARPATVSDGAAVDLGDGQQHVYDSSDVASSDVRQAQRMGLDNVTQKPTVTVDGKAYPDRASADAAAAKYNAPEATDQRISMAMAQTGDVKGAKQYQASARQEQVSAMDLADRHWSQQLRTAMGSGHEGLADFVSRSEAGPMAGQKLKAVPNPDGTVTYAKVNEDGTTQPLKNLTFTNDQDGVIRAAYMLDRTIKPEARYEHMVAEDKQKAAVTAKENELALRERELTEVKIPNAETRAELAKVQGALAEIRAERAQNAGNDKTNREERMKYSTLFTDAGRRMQDTSKSLNTLRMDRAYMRRAQVAGSPEAAQLKDLTDALAQHKQERELYQGLLANSQSTGGGTPAPAAAPSSAAPAAAPTAAPAAPAASARKVSPAEQAARDADRASILNDELTKARQRLASGDTRAQGDIEALNREIAGTRPQVTLASTTPKAAPAPKASTPAAAPAAKAGGTRDNPTPIKSAADRDKLPKGAYYTAPNGQTYIKQ